MAEESTKDQSNTESAEKKELVVKKKQKGLISRIWNGMFRLHGDDFEKRLQHISKEEAAVLARLKRRSQSRRRILRNLVMFSLLAEVIAISYAIMTTRSLDLNWKMRALRVFPMFLIPALAFLSHSTLVSLMTMWDRKDQKTVERLRAERQAKIDELKERTNYYTTQQLIQRYDPDPAAKAAAATVLASKLGADSGLKVYLGDESALDSTAGKSHDAEHVQSTGLRQRKHGHVRSNSVGSTVVQSPEGDLASHAGSEGQRTPPIAQAPTVEHYQPQGPNPSDGGWIAKLAALLVGEDPTQSYALICGNCHMHNGLARKEDFPYITYYCPHCNALNRSKQSPDNISSGISTPDLGPGQSRSVGSDVGNKLTSTLSDPTAASASYPVSPISEIEEVSENVAS
uniref:Lunapark zinc ribbon domain-containing protein n=1 Tax=Kalanchoe fedtschenkoi TaxID=63787 RepID=A0A7N0T1R7_KALFE